MLKNSTAALGLILFSVFSAQAHAKTENISSSPVLTVVQDDQPFQIARKYKLEKSDVTGWYRYTCKYSSGSGYFPTKRDARQAARANCPSGAYNIEEIDVYERQYKMRNIRPQAVMVG